MFEDGLEQSSVPAFKWWEARRLRYNIGLVVAGILAFVAYLGVLMFFQDRIPEAEINLFIIFAQGIAYLLFMVAANIFYFFGALSERLPRVRDLESHRRFAYDFGFWFSVALPFMGPLLLAYYAIFHSEALQHNYAP